MLYDLLEKGDYTNMLSLLSHNGQLLRISNIINSPADVTIFNVL